MGSQNRGHLVVLVLELYMEGIILIYFNSDVIVILFNGHEDCYLFKLYYDSESDQDVILKITQFWSYDYKNFLIYEDVYLQKMGPQSTICYRARIRDKLNTFQI